MGVGNGVLRVASKERYGLIACFMKMARGLLVVLRL